MRRLVMAISGSGYAPSRVALDELLNRIDNGLSATIGGCHFSPVQTPRDRADNDSKKLYVYRLFREIGRQLNSMTVGAGDEVVFAGCWLVKTQLAGMLQAFGDVGKHGNVVPPLIVRKNMPEDWHLIPHKARQAIPVLTTLDGGLFYPQITICSINRTGAPLAAEYLGMANNPVFLANTLTSGPC